MIAAESLSHHMRRRVDRHADLTAWVLQMVRSKVIPFLYRTLECFQGHCTGIHPVGVLAYGMSFKFNVQACETTLVHRHDLLSRDKLMILPPTEITLHPRRTSGYVRGIIPR